MPAFGVTNKPQSYCAFDHSIDTGTLSSGAITDARATAVADTGHTFTV